MVETGTDKKQSDQVQESAYDILQQRLNRQRMAGHDLEADLRNFLLMLWRRKTLIFSVIAIGVVSVFLLLQTIEPRYTSRAFVMIESGKETVPEFEALISSMRMDSTLILSETEVLKSRNLANRVVDDLGLMRDPEFNPKLRRADKGLLNKMALGSAENSEEENNFKSLSVYGTEMKAIPEEMQTQDKGRVIDIFLRNLFARPVPGSSVLQIEFTAKSPEKSAKITNAIVNAYIEQRLEMKFNATQKLTEWLDARLETLRDQVRNSELAAERFRAENNLTEGARSEVTAQQISELNSQLVFAKSEQAEAKARLDQVKRWIKNPEEVEATSEVINSRLIQNLKLQEADLLRELSDLENRYGPRHPTIINTRNELQDLRQKMRQEKNSIGRAVENELKVASARVQALEDGLREIEERKNVENKARIRLRELEREAVANQAIFDTFLDTYKRSDKQEQLQDAEARVLSYATIPAGPSFPNKPLFLSLTAAACFFLGVALALLIEKLDNAFRTSSQLEGHTGYPCFGIIPEADPSKVGGKIANFVTKNPSSKITEAVRTLRTVLNLRSSTTDEKPKVVTITSSLPGEGKTTLSSWISRVAAKGGEKVILIDCDLRRPNVHRAFGLSHDKTIVDYLSGHASLEDVIVKDEATGLHMIFSKSVPNNALDLINSEKMSKLVASLKQAYDLVILDSPACLAVSDARVLSTMSDQTVYAVKWDKTPREVVGAGVKQFADFNYKNLAFALTNVDIKRHTRYGYGDAVYYYGRYKEYYTSD